LLGTAILGAVAAGEYQTIVAAMKSMSQPGEVIRPNAAYQEYHGEKYKIFLRMYEHFKEIRDLSSKL
jgi:ribulose kinase